MSKKLIGRTALMEETQKPLYDIEQVCLNIEDRLRENLKLSCHWCEYTFFNGTEVVQRKAAEQVAERMKQAGYYCRTGQKEIPSGTKRWFVRVSVDTPKPTLWERFSAALKACLKTLKPKKSR